jgi:hypothetical protein
MKRLALIVAVLALVGGSVFAMEGDYGLTLDTLTLVNSGVVDVSGESQYRAAAWGQLFQATDKGGSLDLTGQLSYRYTASRPYIVDLDLLRFTGLFAAEIGRASCRERV